MNPRKERYMNMKNAISVCSWSFQKPIRAVAEAMRTMGVKQVHLALQPFLEGNRSLLQFLAVKAKTKMLCGTGGLPMSLHRRPRATQRTGKFPPIQMPKGRGQCLQSFAGCFVMGGKSGSGLQTFRPLRRKPRGFWHHGVAACFLHMSRA